MVDYFEESEKRKNSAIKTVTKYIRDHTPIDGSPLDESEAILFEILRETISNAQDSLVSMHESIGNEANLVYVANVIRKNRERK